MGSEFAYEDLSSQEVEKYTYKYLRDESINGRDNFVVERKPQYKYSGYTRLVTWIDKEMYQPVKVEFYDRKNTPLKTLQFNEYKQYEEKYWRPDHMRMDNHQTKKSTDLYWENYRFNSGLSARDFDRNSLKRTR